MRLTSLLASALLVLAFFAVVGDSTSHSALRRHHAPKPKEPIAPPSKTDGGVGDAPIEDGEDNGTDQDNDENPTPPLSKPAPPTPVTSTTPAAPSPASATGDIPAAGLAGPDANPGVQEESEANANAVRNDNGLFCSNIGPRHLTLQCKEHPDGNCCGSAGFCCPKDHYCSLDANGHATSKCVKRRKQIVISPTIIIHTGANGINVNGVSSPSTAASTGLPDGVDTSDDVDDSDANEDSGLEDQDYNANSQLDVVPHRSGSLSHPRRDKIVLVMKNRNKITRGKKHQADKDEDSNDDDDDDSDDGSDRKSSKKDATKEGNTDADATAADPTGAAKNVPADK